MTAFNIKGSNGASYVESNLAPGDIMLGGESVSVVSSTTGALISASSLLGGIISRQGSLSANVTDALDSASNILYQLSGGNLGSQPVVDPGTTFRVRILNTTSYQTTLSLAANGLLQGSGTFAISSTTWKDFLFTAQSSALYNTYNCAITSGSPNVYFVLPNWQASQPLLPAGEGITITENALVTGTGIPANAQVIGVIHGQGGLLGFTMSANATATSAGTSVTISPCIRVDEIGSGSL